MDVESNCERVQKGRILTMWDDNNQYKKSGDTAEASVREWMDLLG